MTMWKPGMRCVCVAPPAIASLHGELEPSVGTVYTVRSILVLDQTMGLRLEEIVNHERLYRQGFTERAFYSHRFRPLSETRLDQFRQHLAPKPKVEERV